MPQINASNAAYYASLGGKARWEAYRKEQEALGMPKQTGKVKPEADFVTTTLVRVRKQMQLVQTKIEKLLFDAKLDSKAFKELTEAFSRLEIAEQKLSGRHAPGSYRPSSKPGRSDKRRAAPIVSPETPS